MLTIAQIKEKLGPEPEIILKQVNYIAYHKGEVFYFDTKDEAKKFKLYEEVVINQEDVDTSNNLCKLYNNKVYNRWFALLQEEYSDISPKVFNVIYSKAYDDVGDYGYDIIAEKFNELYNFFRECITAKPSR